MAKFYGNIGYIKTVEVKPGIWDEQVIVYPYYGDVIRNISKSQPSGGVNNDINVSSTISIVADPFANENFQYMKYVEFMGAKWCITSVDPQPPRLILTLGGVYNENTSGSTN